LNPLTDRFHDIAGHRRTAVAVLTGDQDLRDDVDPATIGSPHGFALLQKQQRYQIELTWA
jgi:hypothetical protein